MVVVGGGMIGSLAAKWLAEMCKDIVALVGETELSKKEEGILFGAWFD